MNSIPIIGCTVKLNIALKELPNFHREIEEEGDNKAIHEGQCNLPLSMKEWEEAFDCMKRGEIYHKLWCEIYFHTALDKTVSPNGLHQMSVFAQYVPAVFSDSPSFPDKFDPQVLFPSSSFPFLFLFLL